MVKREEPKADKPDTNDQGKNRTDRGPLPPRPGEGPTNEPIPKKER